jgi:two-component system, cell cycle sensor histidine kinase and response regulator CckA
MPLVASVHVAPASQVSDGAELSEVAVVESSFGDPPPVLNVVDVAVTFQPAPDPVASPMSIACAEVTVWSSPFNVAENVTFGGVETKPSEPAEMVAVPVAAIAATGSAAASAAAASARPSREIRFKVIKTPFVMPDEVGSRNRASRGAAFVDVIGHRAAVGLPLSGDPRAPIRDTPRNPSFGEESEHLPGIRETAAQASGAQADSSHVAKPKAQPNGKASGDPYRLLFEHVGHMVCTLDLDGRLTSVNAAGARLTGYAEKDLIGRPAVELIAAELRDEAIHQFRRRLVSGSAAPPDISILVTRDGRRIPVEVTSTLMRAESGEPTGVLGLIRDVSERRAAANALLESEQRFGALLDAAPDGIVIVNAVGTIVLVNAQTEVLFGYMRDELFGLPVESVLPGIGGAGSDHVSAVSLSARHRDGREFPVDVTLSPLDTEGGSLVVAAVRDVTERKRDEESLLESEERFRSAFDYAAIGMALVGLDGSWLQVNRALCELVGYSRDELLELTFQDLTHPDDLETDLGYSNQTLAGEIDTYQMEKRYFHKRGDVVWVLLSVSLVRTRDGAPLYFISQIQDITARKQAQQERDRLRDDLHHAQKLEAIGRLAGGVAHDFNNMLTAIKGYSELLLGALDPRSPLHGHAAQIKRAADQASTLPRQLLAFSRKQAVEPGVSDLSAVIADIGDLLRRLVGEAVTLELDVARAVPARVDAAQLEQVVVNLALNARDAMPDGGMLTISTRHADVDDALASEHDASAGRYAVIGVYDTGHGIDNETKVKIFEPFFTTKGVGEGSGLGLASAYGAVRQSGGFIRVQSEPGYGTRFDLYFPAETPGATSAARDDAPSVLLAEDEEIVRELAVSVLEGAGFAVRTAANGQAAAELYAREADAIDVVVTDMVMPEMGGRELAEHVLRGSPQMPIVYMSGYTEDSPPADGAAVFLQKPFSADALVQAVKAAVGELPRVSASVRASTGTTCIVADDHPAVLDAISHYLGTQGVQIVGRAADGFEALRQIDEHRPAVALLDVAMQPLDGFEIAEEARRLSPETRTIIYTGHGDEQLLARVRDVGAAGVVLKEAPLAELVQALGFVAGGGTYIDPQLLTIGEIEDVPDVPHLTPREQEILGYLAEGKTNDKVALELGISAETVQSHVHNAMTKLDAGTRTEAVAIALRRSLIE